MTLMPPGSLPEAARKRLNGILGSIQGGWVAAAVTDGQDATDGLLAACEELSGLNNAAPVTEHGGGVILLPRGDFTVSEKIPVPPGVEIWGAGADATRLVASTGLATPIVGMERPAGVAGYTRRTGLRYLSIKGDGTAGQKGIWAESVAEVVLDRVIVDGCDYGADFDDVIGAEVTACKFSGNVSRGFRGANGCNGFELDRLTRINTTSAGANLEIDGGGLQGFGWTVAAIIESALHATDGWGILIGQTEPCQDILLLNPYFENNKVGCVKVGDTAASGVSSVTSICGHWVGPANTYGMLIEQGFVKAVGGYWDAITAGYELVLNNTSAFARIQNFTDQPVSGTGANNTSGSSFENQTAYLSELHIGGRTANYGQLSANGSTDIRYAGDLPLFLGTDVKLGGGDKKVGFYNSAGAVKGTITGSRGGNAALANLLTYLASLGLLTDGSSA